VLMMTMVMMMCVCVPFCSVFATVWTAWRESRSCTCA
jgi:hypothetical protein